MNTPPAKAGGFRLRLKAGSTGRNGSLWEGRYRATVIDSKRYLLTCMRYIELNPDRAGMVAHP